MDYINQGDFCFVQVDHLEEHGLAKGGLCFVAGMRAFPITEEDPYTQRIQCLVHRCNDGGEIDMEAGFFVVDPDSLKKVSPEDQEDFMDALEAQMDEMELMTAPVESEMNH